MSSKEVAEMPEAGRNAAVELSKQIIQLKDLGSTVKGTTVNWSVIQAGDRVNIIPEKASATADMRMSDAGFAYNAKTGNPVVLDGMAIVGDRIHSSDEWGDLDSVVPRLYLTVRMMEAMGKEK